MKKNRIGFLLFLLVLFITPQFTVTAKNNITIYYYYDEECVNCKNMSYCIEQIIQEKDNVYVEKYSIKDDYNYSQMKKIKKNLTDKNISGIPFVAVGEKYIVGYYDESTCNYLKRIINTYEQGDYTDKIRDIINNNANLTNEASEENKSDIIDDEVVVDNFALILVIVVALLSLGAFIFYKTIIRNNKKIK